ncbi:hypothetical protein D1871_07735 [Nakamurella silvestris]|nr:hypothetical protein D1871_07735 [Nakamurella silvestris]
MKHHEEALFRFLAENMPELQRFVPHIASFLVEDMNDGSMGSLRFCHSHGPQAFGREVGAVEVLDLDGKPVSVSVNLDRNENLFEIDVFKCDSSPTIRLELRLRR